MCHATHQSVIPFIWRNRVWDTVTRKWWGGGCSVNWRVEGQGNVPAVNEWWIRHRGRILYFHPLCNNWLEQCLKLSEPNLTSNLDGEWKIRLSSTATVSGFLPPWGSLGLSGRRGGVPTLSSDNPPPANLIEFVSPSQTLVIILLLNCAPPTMAGSRRN